MINIRYDLMSKDCPSIWLQINGDIGKVLICFYYGEWFGENKLDKSTEAQRKKYNILLSQFIQAGSCCKKIVCLGDANLNSSKFNDPSYYLRNLVNDLETSI